MGQDPTKTQGRPLHDQGRLKPKPNNPEQATWLFTNQA
ncbi:hypothetical protein MCC93_00890 [Morococcus cerebrosus]|uniref:Uncharacterized protein n=1 Tax=Morococcus cerebrosus TaxID=1056807 RepID=A0A0C1EVJ3_9NEIS|nr:hypothetical protein MCC93_00890 [Morococcus cerebrosus]